MTKFYICSTLTNDQHYTNYKASNGGPAVAVEAVTIKGGSNRADMRLITPRGVVTEVTDEQMEILNRNHVFKAHVTSGHIVVNKTSVAPEKTVDAHMEAKDGSAPYTPESLAAKSAAKPMAKGK